MQIIQDYYNRKPVYMDFGGITSAEWAEKEYIIRGIMNSSYNRINFTNNYPDAAAEFYIADVSIKKIMD